MASGSARDTGAELSARLGTVADAHRLKRIAALDPATYQRHLIHGANRAWAETNCYTDVVIELLHGLGHEPIAALPFTLAIDFEGDQWTFFKFPHADLFELFGFDIQELAVWRPLAEHVAEQVGAGRPVLVELDSYFLPDTAGTAYQLAHVKSTVAVNEIDIERRHLGYFHNQGYYAVEGADFADVFQLDGLVHERMLPPYVEYVKPRPGFVEPTGRDLSDASLGILKKHLARVPRANPFARFKARFTQDLEWLLNADIERFHVYSFATLRQYGACYELSETYLRWLGGHGLDKLDVATQAFQQISQTAKAFQFQLARSIARKKPLELAPLDAMAGHWDLAMTQLQSRFG
jgi:hypothetical protein